jgi:hypothetical protein
MLEMLSGMLPLLVSVTVLAELEWPTLIVPKLKDAGEAVAVVIPFPVKLTVCGLFEAPSVNVSVCGGRGRLASRMESSQLGVTGANDGQLPRSAPSSVAPA